MLAVVALHWISIMYSGIASYILDMPEAELEINARKVRRLCEAELLCASADGTLPRESTRNWNVFGIAQMIRTQMHVDCEENEGYNSLVRPSDSSCLCATCVPYVCELQTSIKHPWQ
jgi:hypothetical protein